MKPEPGIDSCPNGRSPLQRDDQHAERDERRACDVVRAQGHGRLGPSTHRLVPGIDRAGLSDGRVKPP